VSNGSKSNGSESTGLIVESTEGPLVATTRIVSVPDDRVVEIPISPLVGPRTTDELAPSLEV
jgi:hypothetical protein